jgi:hypothetical protein
MTTIIQKNQKTKHTDLLNLLFLKTNKPIIRKIRTSPYAQKAKHNQYFRTKPNDFYRKVLNKLFGGQLGVINIILSYGTNNVNIENFSFTTQHLYFNAHQNDANGEHVIYYKKNSYAESDEDEYRQFLLDLDK